MRTSRRASNVEVPSLLRQLVKETGKLLTFFLKGERAEGVAGDLPDEESDDGVVPSPYLDRPILEKHVAEGETKWGASYAVASMQGWRVHMEDAHTCTPEMDGGPAGWSYFAVFDGHAGNMVAQYCSHNLLDNILATGAVKDEEDQEEVMEGIREGFLRIDKHMHNLARRENWDRSGSTAAAVLISPSRIYFINCGDSRTFLCRDGQVSFYTEDHKPCNPREKERIQNAGGSVTLQRVNGSLAVSRALGDFDFKEVEWRTQTEQLVSPEPEVFEMERSPDDEFLILACDGVWDAISNEELCAFVRSRLYICDDLREICTQVLDLCLYKGSLDNMSIIIICFPGAPQVSPEALQREAELEEVIESKVTEALQLLRSKDEEPDLLYVIKFLTSENIPGLPPGGGIASKRDCIISAYQKLTVTYRKQLADTARSAVADGGRNMPLQVNGDPGYGSVAASAAPAGSPGGSETAPLLIPDAEPQGCSSLGPLSKEELELVAGDPWWRQLRFRLVLLFWLGWLAMLGTAIAIIATSPRPVAPPLLWWQRALFYRMQPALLLSSDGGGAEGINGVRNRLPYLQSLGVGALVLEGLFTNAGSPSGLLQLNGTLGTLAQLQEMITEGHSAGVKIVLDLCNLDLSDPVRTDGPTETPGPVLNALQFWLEHGVAGFGICDTDVAYSEQILLEWRILLQEYSQGYNERIVVVRQVRQSSPELNGTGSVVNSSLVELVTQPLLPSSPHPMSALEVAVTVETVLVEPQRQWPSWTVGGTIPLELRKILMVLSMALPGTPVINYGEEIIRPQNASTSGSLSYGEMSLTDETAPDSRRVKRAALALFHSLSHSRTREEALIFGNFTFLPFSSNSSSSTSAPSPAPPPGLLAFLRSWGCVHFLVLLNFGPQTQALDPSWTDILPAGGVYVTSTGLDRVGSVSLTTLTVNPLEAVVIKLFEDSSYS
ncbi:hypothetical protein GJAV_G00051610 [Gymnothorax javanicus]|nr:hypothetical protein GJAV_G00051610 [Gymnothorax javanicus]